MTDEVNLSSVILTARFLKPPVESKKATPILADKIDRKKNALSLLRQYRSLFLLSSLPKIGNILAGFT